MRARRIAVAVRQPRVRWANGYALPAVIADSGRECSLERRQLRVGERPRVILLVNGLQLAFERRRAERQTGVEPRVRIDREHLRAALHVGDLLPVLGIAGVGYAGRSIADDLLELALRGSCVLRDVRHPRSEERR